MKQLLPAPPSKYRKWFNEWVKKNAKGNVLEIGKSVHWDYEFPTLDINPALKPTFVGNIEKTNFPDGVYDMVLCNGMCEFVSNTQAMVDEVMRILKPGGIAAFGFVGKDYQPYKPDWNFYDNDVKFKNILETKNFNKEYHYIICQKS